MAATIEREFGIEPELIGGHSGIFDVQLDGESVFGNDPALCGVPEDAPVLEALRKAGL